MTRVNGQKARNLLSFDEDIFVSALSFAIVHEHGDIAQSLLDDGRVDVNGRDFNCDTPLIVATRARELEIVKLLCANKTIDINIQNLCGDTALSIAVECDYTEAVEVLVAQPNIHLLIANGEGDLLFSDAQGVIKAMMGNEINRRWGSDWELLIEQVSYCPYKQPDRLIQEYTHSLEKDLERREISEVLLGWLPISLMIECLEGRGITGWKNCSEADWHEAGLYAFGAHLT